MRLPVFTALVALVALPAWATGIYRHVDAQGRVSFTDQPPDGAAPVELPPLNSVPAVTPAPARAAGTVPGGAAFAGYRLLAFTSHDQDQTLRNPEGPLVVTAMLQPPLQPGHTLTLRHNGQVANADNHAAVRIDQPERGTHSFDAEVTDAAGTVLMRADTLRLHVHRPSKLLRPGG